MQTPVLLQSFFYISSKVSQRYWKVVFAGFRQTGKTLVVYCIYVTAKISTVCTVETLPLLAPFEEKSIQT